MCRTEEEIGTNAGCKHGYMGNFSFWVLSKEKGYCVVNSLVLKLYITLLTE